MFASEFCQSARKKKKKGELLSATYWTNGMPQNFKTYEIFSSDDMDNYYTKLLLAIPLQVWAILQQEQTSMESQQKE